jgi:CcmD family protein
MIHHNGMKKGMNIGLRNWMASLLVAVGLLGMPLAAAAFNSGDPNFALVLRDSSGQALAGQAVEVLVELTTGRIDGQAQYAETHAGKTAADGMLAIAIGFGKPTDPKYVFDNFDAAQGDNFVRISIQEAGGWRLVLDSQMPNVPKLRKWLFADEKSNTVIAVMITVWLGIVVYLLLSSRKMRRLEKQVAALKQARATEN